MPLQWTDNRTSIERSTRTAHDLESSGGSFALCCVVHCQADQTQDLRALEVLGLANHEVSVAAARSLEEAGRVVQVGAARDAEADQVLEGVIASTRPR